VPLPLGTFLLLRDLIRDRLGVWFEENNRDLLAAKLSDRIAALGLQSFLEYYYRLKYGPDADAEWPRLTDALSVQETYFWREIEQIRTLVDVLIPQHVTAGLGPIRIWSAACASGEEPLTLAIALSEAGWFGRANIELLASDVSSAALEKAASGIYRERSFRALPATLREKYFSPVKDGWRVDPLLHGRVRFRQANLLDSDETALLESSRYIFCRNVFIYFATATIAEVVSRFAERMPRPGYLFVGVSESLLRAVTSFKLDEVNGVYVYVRR
jgi:chemotaxis protein methyltransferase CheR